MSVFGTSIAQSMAGATQAERVAVRESERKRPAPKPDRAKREQDGLDLEVQNAQATDAVRSLKQNAQEETNEDRQEHDGYSPKPPVVAKHLDVQA